MNFNHIKKVLTSDEGTIVISNNLFLKKEIKDKIKLPNKPYKIKLTYSMGDRVADLRDKGNEIKLCENILDFYGDLSYSLKLAKNLNKGTIIELQRYKLNRIALKNISIQLKKRYKILKLDLSILINQNKLGWEMVRSDFNKIIPDLIFVEETSGVIEYKDIIHEKLNLSLIGK